MMKRFTLWLLSKVFTKRQDVLQAMEALNPTRENKLEVVEKLYPLTHEKVTVDGINKKLIRPVPNLVIDGVQYYEFVNVADMPQARLVHFNYLREEMMMGIGRPFLNEFIDNMMAANKAGDVNRMGSLLFMLRDTVTNITSIESLYNLACLLRFDEREDLSTFDADYNKLKLERFKRYPNKDFFFSELLRSSLKLTGLSLPPDIREFLNANAVKLRAYKQMVSATGD
jgi:hypothetical protein